MMASWFLSSLPSPQQSCQDLLAKALWRLEAPVPWPVLHSLADLIVGCVSGPNRSYHTLSHILQVAMGEDPLEILAALFHDCVYEQTDGGIHPLAYSHLAPYLTAGANLSALDSPWSDRYYALATPALEVDTRIQHFQDPGFALVASVFQIKPHQLLVGPACNEFLSALLAVKVLEPYLTSVQLVQIAAAIELTTPFRLSTPAGNPCDRLYQALLKTNEQFQLDLTPADCHRMVNHAIQVAHRDLAGFAHTEVSVFLSQTWQLLPELNPALRLGRSYVLQDYRQALWHMEKFMLWLQPDQIFPNFRHAPKTTKDQQMIWQTSENLMVARFYFCAHLTTLALLEASISCHQAEPFVIKVRGESFSTAFALAIGQLPGLPGLNLPKWQPLQMLWGAERQALDLLLGRSGVAEAEALKFATAGLLAKTLGFQRLMRLREHAELLFQGQINAVEFLQFYADHVNSRPLNSPRPYPVRMYS